MTAVDLSDNGQDNDVAVCVQHMRFVPCRRNAPKRPCRISTDARDVNDVRAYQADV